MAIVGKKVVSFEERMGMKEHDMQVYIFDVLRTLEEKFPILKTIYAIPNGAKLPYTKNKKGVRYSKQAKHLLNEGLRPGVPDICVPYSDGTGNSALYIEMKRPGNKSTPQQEEMQKLLQDLGNKVVVCYSIKDALIHIQGYTCTILNTGGDAERLHKAFEFYLENLK